MSEEYLLRDQPSELQRLQLQSQVWERAGRQLLSELGSGSGRRALDVGCGALGWLRILGEWVGPPGQVVGTDVDGGLLDAARAFLETEGISGLELVVDARTNLPGYAARPRPSWPSRVDGGRPSP